MDHDLQIRATGKYGPRGERYEVLLGEEVIAFGSSPEFAACRVLQERGFTGFARLWREGKSNWDLRLSIKTGAGLTVVENAKIGPRLGKWAPNPMFADKREEEAA
jgi:hypothetical protein